MRKKALAILCLSLLLFTFTDVTWLTQRNLAEAQNKSEIPDYIVYEQLFRLLIRFEEQSANREKLGDNKGAAFFRGFFERQIGLNPQQAKFLKTATKEFFDETKSFDTRAEKIITAKQQKRQNRSFKSQLEELKQRRLHLPSLYLQRIETFFGAAEFEKFTAFVRDKIASKMSRFVTAEGFSGYRMSEIFYDNGAVYGYSSTSGDGYSPETGTGFSGYCDWEEGEQCPYTTVVATLSSQLEGAIDVQQEGVCGGFAQVDFYISDANYSDVYCINGQHAFEENDPYCYGFNAKLQASSQPEFSDATEDCVDTPQLNVTGVGFQLIATDSPPIDTNPNAGDGLRIFPDDNTPGDTTNRQTIRVTATLSERIAGETIYFRNFDLDDPSNDPVIDPLGNAGDDNNGMPRAGRLNNSNGQATVSAATNSNGVATVEFTVTMQPGDNFAIAASRNQNYVGGIAVNGTELRNGGTLIDTACADTDSACRTEMLTVWRRLHIEVDSMGAAQGNFVMGATTADTRIKPYQTVPIDVNSTLEENRFEGGRVEFSNGNSFPVTENTASVITVQNTTGSTYNFANGTQFQLFDDDDFNDDDVGALNGDTGDEIPRPDTTLLSISDDESLNVFAPAYIRPAQRPTGGENEDVPFAANTGETEITNLFNTYFDNQATEADTEFWTVYLLGGYQFRTNRDGDPYTLVNGFLNTVWGASDTGNRQTVGRGSILFTEEGRAREYPADWANRPVSRAHTVAHEVGHLFGCIHDDGGLMDDTTRRTSGTLTPPCLNQIRRNATHP